MKKPDINIRELAKEIEPLSFQQKISYVSGKLIAAGFDPSITQKFAKMICKAIMRGLPPKEIKERDPIQLTESDLAKLHELFYNNGQKEENLFVRLFVIALTSTSHVHSHPNGWIRYDKPTLIEACGMTGMKMTDITEVTCTIHDKYGMSMRVVGSNDPIPCFNLSWLNTIDIDIADFGPLCAESLLLVDQYIASYVPPEKPAKM